MKIMKKIIAAALTAFVAFMNITPVLADDTPYQGYTYNEWGEPVSAPNGYIPEALVTGAKTGTGDFKEPKDLFVDRENKELFIADSGNNRIVILDEDFNLIRVLSEFTGPNGTETLNNPTGVFVDKAGLVYIADRENGRILVSDKLGKVVRIYGAPVSDLIADDFVYYPEKVVADRHGRLYVQAFGAFQGILCMDSEGNFLNYFGSNRVELTAKVMIDRVWKKLLTREQKNAMEGFVPIEYSNMSIDEEDFIYACVRTSENSTYELKKLNPLGVNILRSKRSNSYLYSNSDYGDHPVIYDGSSKIDSVFVDICIDDDHYISALDSTRGKVFQYDEESNLMFVFGGLGDQRGTFKSPSSLESLNGKMLVLDSVKNNITVFGLTAFGELVRKANMLYHNGFYLEALEPWKEVLKYDSNYLLAYVGLGKAYYQMQEYEKAMHYFKMGYDKMGYSEAFKAYSTELMRSNFDKVLLVVVLLIAAYQLIRRRKKLMAFISKLTSLPFYIMLHPVQGFESVKWSGKGSYTISFVLMIALFLYNVVDRQMTGFIYNIYHPDKINILSLLLITCGTCVVWFLSNLSLTSLMEGEGRAREIWIVSMYSLMPYLLINLAMVVLTNLLSLEAAAFISMAKFGAFCWSSILMFTGMYVIHQYSVKKTVVNIVLTLVGMAVIVFLLILVFSLFQQLFVFLLTMYNEIMFRL